MTASPPRRTAAAHPPAGPPPAVAVAAVAKPGTSAPPVAGVPGAPLSPGLMKIALAMSEEQLLSKITLGTRREPGICEQLGLGWIHHRRSEMTNPGWPDLVVKARPGRAGVMFRELKKQRGKVTAAQQEWLDALTADGLNAAVWRPSDYLCGRVARELAALAGMRTL